MEIPFPEKLHPTNKNEQSSVGSYPNTSILALANPESAEEEILKFYSFKLAAILKFLLEEEEIPDNP